MDNQIQSNDENEITGDICISMLQRYTHDMGHYLANSLFVIDRLSHFFESSNDASMDAVSRRLADLKLNTLEMLLFNKNTRYLFLPDRTLGDDLEYRDIFLEINQLTEIHENMSNRKRLDIITDFPHDIRLPIRKTCREYIWQIFFNLLNNAVRYSYHDTKVHINIKKPNDNLSDFILTITDYGRGIEDSSNIYDPFNIKDNIHTPRGLGLYVSKKLVDILHGNIQYKCTLISDYCVPLIEAYLHREFCKPKDESLMSCLYKELARLRDKNIYEKIVSDGLNDSENKKILDKIPEGQILDQINIATYETSFEVSI